MDSSINKLFTAMDAKEISLDDEISKMSPVTNLAHNLSGLRTSVAGTPIRRISWSNPIPGGDKIGMNVEDLSPSDDSPTVQYAIMKSNVRNKREPYNNRQRRTLTLDNDDINKENLTPVSKTISKPVRIECEKRSCTSTDSGYSSISVTNKFSLGSEEPKNSWKNFTLSPTSEDENSMETIFFEPTEDQENLPVPESFNSLLTKPLQSIFKSPPKLPPSLKFRKGGKLPMRRCLSKEAAFDSDPGPSNSRSVGSLLLSPDDEQANIDFFVNSQFKRPDPPIDLLENQSKRRRSSPNIDFKSKPSGVKLQRSFSETAATIMHAILKSDLQPELVGDGTRVCTLPLVKGRHDDLKSISSETMADLLKGEIKGVSFVIVDCRYPYEFEGGHIQGAENIFTKEGILEKFLSNPTDSPNHTTVIIFHCEFSSERAPTLCRFLRNKDRELNEGNYPRLHHPELYILEGGYKAFFASFTELCEPQAYKPMNHKDHGTDLRLFRAKSKSWGADSKGRITGRSLSKASNV